MEQTQIKPPKRVARVIFQFGGAAPLADALGISRVAVWKWQDKDSIPSKWQPKLLELARSNGIELKAEDLIG